MDFDKHKLYKNLAIIAGICVLVAIFTQYSKHSSMTLTEYEALHPELAENGEDDQADLPTDTSKPSSDEYETASATNSTASADDPDALTDTSSEAEKLQEKDHDHAVSTLIGASLNTDSMKENRTTIAEGFYYEPLSDNLRRYITGVSYPTEDTDAHEISYEDLSYVHILHYDFEGNPAEGELICNQLIAQDLAEIFYELYQNEYFLEKVRLIDEYDGDDDASMADNNTSCFNYRSVAGSTSLSKHALGMAVDINPLYNPYITYNGDGTENIAPVSASVYADRDNSFPYKIDESDLCYKLFTQHGFTWGGNWNSCKDYQHFQKTENQLGYDSP